MKKTGAGVLAVLVWAWPLVVWADPMEKLPVPKLLTPPKSSSDEGGKTPAKSSTADVTKAPEHLKDAVLLNANEPHCPLLYGSFSFVVLHPVFEDNPAYTTSSSGGGGATMATNTAFPYDLAVCPAMTVGINGNNNFGGRLRCLRLDQMAHTSTANLAPLAGTSAVTTPVNVNSLLTAGSDLRDDFICSSFLRLDTFDVESTYQFEAAHWQFLASTGIRYMHLAQRYTADKARTFPSTVTGSSLYEKGVEGGSFNGSGLTFALEAQQTMGLSGLGMYSSARGSVLFGKSLRTQVTYQHEVSHTADNTTSTFVRSDRHDLLPGLEMEVGLQYQADWGRVLPMLRLGFVGQMWFGAGTAFQDVGNMGLLGMNATIGMAF